MSVLPPRPGVESAGLPDHTVIVNRRAKRIRIKVTAEDGVVVVVPRPSDVRRVRGVLLEHRAWVRRALERTADRRAHLLAAVEGPLPQSVDLPGIGLSSLVRYRLTSASRVRASERDGEVVLSGNTGDAAACRAALRRWVARTASAHLPRLVADVAMREGLTHGGVSVRAQRSRWGSCTRDGRISLNRSLVFLHPEQVHYVIMHELLHTVRHDHSPEFWRMLCERVPDAPGLRRGLRDAWRAVPPWATERV